MDQEPEVNEQETSSWIRLLPIVVMLIGFAFVAYNHFTREDKVNKKLLNEAIAEANFLEKNQAEHYTLCHAYDMVLSRATSMQDQTTYETYSGKRDSEYCH